MQNASKLSIKIGFHKRTFSFLALGDHLSAMDKDRMNEVYTEASYQNPWFTIDNIKLSMEGLCHYLDETKLKLWLQTYQIQETRAKKIGVVMAGNIPMVGMHDLICILLSGHKAMVKLSSQDDVLIRFIVKELLHIAPEFSSYIEFAAQLKGMDAVIATGSDNTSRYFDYYFGKYPHIIRKNRTSIAVLDGQETEADLQALGLDIFTYFGLGCRNVSKLYLPAGYDITRLLPHFEAYNHLVNHNKYGNNYFYNRSIFLVNQSPHLDNGFALFQQSSKLVSPISVVYYDFYDHPDQLNSELKSVENKIQCMVSQRADIPHRIKFGKAQQPELWDYADNIDTMKFLSGL
ncbi:MAG: acyl-CoA reductase [Cyclobacteriaceae bacterium]|nr:acyl-CoA reductase [Cyclobacteriaceae bacterium]